LSIKSFVQCKCLCKLCPYTTLYALKIQTKKLFYSFHKCWLLYARYFFPHEVRELYIIELPFIHYTNEQHSRNTRLTINRLKDYFTWFQKVAPGIISISAIIVWNCNFKTHNYDNIYFIIWLITLNKKKEQ